MIWVVVFINMYRYERNFGSFYRSPTIQSRFLLKYNDRENFITDASVFR